MAGADSASTTLLWSAVSGFIVLSMAVPFFATWPSTFDVLLCLALGIIASTGQYMMVIAYRQAAASLLAPFSYIQLIWSTSLGYLVFAAVPDGWTFVGSAIIIGSGLYTVQRERTSKAETRSTPVAKLP
jgi:drug/metabolite transporter (DMT)-like permease